MDDQTPHDNPLTPTLILIIDVSQMDTPFLPLTNSNESLSFT